MARLPALADFAATRSCARCGLPHPCAEFVMRSGKSRYLASWCGSCHATYSRTRKGSPSKYAKFSVWRQRKGSEDALAMHARRIHDGDRARNTLASRISQYGLDVQGYHDLLDAQGGGCAICAAKPRDGKRGRLCVDHDHLTKRVRGLLCGKCNRGIGSLGDSVEGVAAALAYLKRGA